MPCPNGGCLADSIRAYKQGENYLKEQGVKLKQTFETFKMVPGAREAYNFAKEFSSASGPLFYLLYGGVGNGKTHLCNAAAVALLGRGVACKFYTVADLLSLLRSKIDNGTIEEEITILKEAPCLILDDWKTESQSDWANGRLEEVIDYRYRMQLPIMLTTNRDLTEIPERILSRFSDVDIAKRVLNTAPDYRRRQK